MVIVTQARERSRVSLHCQEWFLYHFPLSLCHSSRRTGTRLLGWEEGVAMSGDFSEYRKAIDRIDDEILRLLNERSKSVIEIGKLKKQRDADAHQSPYVGA